MAFAKELVRSLHDFIARPWILALLVFTNVVAYFGGLLYWYGRHIVKINPPEWVWPFIPDCPLWGLLAGLSLIIVTAKNYWTSAAQDRAQKIILGIGVLFTLLWVATYLPFASTEVINQRALLGVFCWTMLLFGSLFHRAPNWLLAIAAFGNIKYGVWTVSAWIVYWRTTSMVTGAPHFSPDSIAMTTTHLGMIVQGLLLLTYFKPTRIAALVSLLWFALSDFVDYGLGYFPPINQYISLPFMQWSTIAMTILLTLWLLWLSSRPKPLVDDLPSSTALDSVKTADLSSFAPHTSQKPITGA